MGFEPTDAFTSPVFKTGAFDRSAISPSVKADPFPDAFCMITHPQWVVNRKKRRESEKNLNLGVEK